MYRYTLYSKGLHSVLGTQIHGDVVYDCLKMLPTGLFTSEALIIPGISNQTTQAFEKFKTTDHDYQKDMYDIIKKIIQRRKFLDTSTPHQRLFYGAPGTGKSHQLDEQATELVHNQSEHIIRTVFHTETTRHDFFGGYKPVTRFVKPSRSSTSGTLAYVAMDGSGEFVAPGTGPHIFYEFVPGPFMRALSKAYATGEKVVLIIEEINRANAAAVFGEVFQLLDRENGESRYPIQIPTEALIWLNSALPDGMPKKGVIRLPPNFYIWATMNSADQGVQPMDTAFKNAC